MVPAQKCMIVLSHVDMSRQWNFCFTRNIMHRMHTVSLAIYFVWHMGTQMQINSYGMSYQTCTYSQELLGHAEFTLILPGYQLYLYIATQVGLKSLCVCNVWHLLPSLDTFSTFWLLLGSFRSMCISCRTFCCLVYWTISFVRINTYTYHLHNFIPRFWLTHAKQDYFPHS